MGVVINNFEAVAEAPVRRAAEASPPEPDSGAPEIDPHDVEILLHEAAERVLRSWAH